MSKKDKKKEKQEQKLHQKMKEEIGQPGVIFRFDGTLMNTSPVILASWHHIFAKYAPDVPFDSTLQQMAFTASTKEMAMSYFPKKYQDKVVKEYREYQREHLANLITPMKGVKDFLKWLKKNGYKTGVVSNRNRNSMVEILEHMGLSEYIDVIIGHYDAMSEEDPMVGSLLRCTKLMGTKCVIYIGSNAARIMNARYIGCYTVGFMNDYTLTSDMIEAGADFLTNDYKGVKKLMQGEPMWLAYRVMDPAEQEALAKKAAEKEAKKAEKKAKKAEEKKAEKEEKKKSKKDKKKKESKEEEKSDQKEKKVKKKKEDKKEKKGKKE